MYKRQVESLEDSIGQMDVLYMTRVQQERFAQVGDYLRLKDVYICLLYTSRCV